MKGFSFPLFKTKTEGETRIFALEDPSERRQYFDLKAGTEIEKLRDWLRVNTFVGFLIGKKNSGKGTYSKLFAEAVGPEYTRHISVGDIVREGDQELRDETKRNELVAYLKRRYRGFVALEEAVGAHINRETQTLLPTEMILALVELEIARYPRRALFIDGFPRNLDQVSYALYFRAIMGYRDDPDFFVFIDVPETVVDERMKYRVTCPTCQSPRNIKLLRTKEIGYDEASGQFYLKCDNPNCSDMGARMSSKEGDAMAVDALRERRELDEKVMHMLLELQGVPKIFLRNAVPVEQAREYVDDYEITPSYRYEWDAATGAVRVVEESWVVNDDEGVASYSLLPAAIVVSLIKQVAAVLGV